VKRREKGELWEVLSLLLTLVVFVVDFVVVVVVVIHSPRSFPMARG